MKAVDSENSKNLQSDPWCVCACICAVAYVPYQGWLACDLLVELSLTHQPPQTTITPQKAPPPDPLRHGQGGPPPDQIPLREPQDPA